MKTYFITFTDRDFDLLKGINSIKKKINMLFYEPSIHIYLMEEPVDVKEYEIFLSDDDIKYLQDGNTIIKSIYIDGENAECKLMMESVYDKLPEEVVNANKTITFSMTKIYCVDVVFRCMQENREPSLEELRAANNMKPPYPTFTFDRVMKGQK